MAKIGSPLFILRNECQRDLMAVLDRLGEIGFDGVEFLGLFGNNPAEIRKKLDFRGLSAIGDHVPFAEFERDIHKVIGEHKEIGCEFITVCSLETERLPGGRNYTRTLEQLEQFGEAMNAAGMTLLYHNHAEELRLTANGKSVLENIADDTNPDLLFLEPDLGWIRIGGGDPVHYMEKYRNRCPVIHFKDYIPAKDGGAFLFRPTGYGAMNNAELYEISLSYEVSPKCYIMDHDCAYQRDPFDDLALSLDYFRNLIRITGE